jgi:hypothetical protein
MKHDNLLWTKPRSTHKNTRCMYCVFFTKNTLNIYVKSMGRWCTLVRIIQLTDYSADFDNISYGKPWSNIKCRDSSVGIATGYGLEGRDSISRRGKIFIFSTESTLALGPTQPPIQWVQGEISPGVKRPSRQTDHSPPSRAEIKKGGDIPPLPHTSSWPSV